MKVYRVVMPISDGWTGIYESPLFTKREAAEEFWRRLCELPTDDPRKWGPTHDIERDAYLEEIETYDECPELAFAADYLTITYD